MPETPDDWFPSRRRRASPVTAPDQIVNERQRLVADLRMEADATEELHPDDSEIAVMRQAAVQIERDGERLAKATGEDTKARYYEPLAVLKDMAARLVWSTDLSFRARIDSAIAALEALASPSEGNKKEDEAAEGWWVTPVWKHDGPRLLVLTVGGLRMGSVYDEETLGWSVARDHVEWDGEPYFPTREEAQAALIAAVRGPLASRPQEQPRKAMGEIEEAKGVLSDMAARLVWSNDMGFRDRIKSAIDALGRLSVSPAAAQRWQSVPVAWRVSLPSGAVFLQIEKPTTILDRHNKPIEGAVIDPLYSAAPSSPAAQEQEKGGQT